MRRRRLRLALLAGALLWTCSCEVASTQGPSDAMAVFDGSDTAGTDAEPADLPPLWTLPATAEPTKSDYEAPATPDLACEMSSLWSLVGLPLQGTITDAVGLLAHQTGYVWFEGLRSPAQPLNRVVSLTLEGTVKTVHTLTLGGVVTSAAVHDGQLLVATDAGELLQAGPLGDLSPQWQADDTAAVWGGGILTGLFGEWSAKEEANGSGTMPLRITRRDAAGEALQVWDVAFPCADPGSAVRTVRLAAVEGLDGSLWVSARLETASQHAAAVLRLGSETPVAVSAVNASVELLRVLADGTAVVRWTASPGGQEAAGAGGASSLRLLTASGTLLAAHPLPSDNVVCPTDGRCFARSAAGVEELSPAHGRLGWRACEPGQLVPMRGVPDGRLAGLAGTTLSLLDPSAVTPPDLTGVLVKAPNLFQSGNCTPKLQQLYPQWLSTQHRLEQVEPAGEGRTTVSASRTVVADVPGAQGSCKTCAGSTPTSFAFDSAGAAVWEASPAPAEGALCSSSGGMVAASEAGAWFVHEVDPWPPAASPNAWFLPSGQASALSLDLSEALRLAAHPAGVFVATWDQLQAYNNAGELQWSRRLGDGSLTDLRGSADGSVSIALDEGWSQFYSHVARVDKHGALSWLRTLLWCTRPQFLSAATPALVLCNPGTMDAHVVELREDGSWTPNAIYLAGAQKVLALSDGDFAVLAAPTQGHGVWLQRHKPDGGLRWQRMLPGPPTALERTALVEQNSTKLRLIATPAAESLDEPDRDGIFWADIDFPVEVPCGSTGAFQTVAPTKAQKPWLVEGGTTVLAATWQEGVVLAGVQPGSDGYDDVRIDWVDGQGMVAATQVVASAGSQYPTALAVQGEAVAVVIQHDATATALVELATFAGPSAPPVQKTLPLANGLRDGLVWPQPSTLYIGGHGPDGDGALVRWQAGQATVVPLSGLLALSATPAGLVAATSTELFAFDANLALVSSSTWHWWEAGASPNKNCPLPPATFGAVDVRSLSAHGDTGVALGWSPSNQVGAESTGELFAIAWAAVQQTTWRRRMTTQDTYGPVKLIRLEGDEGYLLAFVGKQGAKLQRLGPYGEYLWQYNLAAWVNPTIVGLTALTGGQSQLVLSLPGQRTAILRP